MVNPSPGTMTRSSPPVKRAFSLLLSAEQEGEGEEGGRERDFGDSKRGCGTPCGCLIPH